MPDNASDKPVQLYTSAPPQWLTSLHKAADVGYPGFHPPRPGQEEDLLSEKFLKDGFASGLGIAAESYSALSTIKEDITEHKFLGYVERILEKVYARRCHMVDEIPPSSFKLPVRTTVNELRRTVWLNDLANSSIPLQKLGRSVPGGVKGHDLLDMLHTNNVTIPRAVWYIRVLGGNETYGMRTRPNFTPSHYSVEWAHTMTSYLKKLIADITLPNPVRPGLNIKQSFKSPFLEPALAERWTNRCGYFLDLLHSCYCEGLVDPYTFLSWLSSQLSPNASSVPQLTLICRLVEEYVDGVTRYRQLTRITLHESLGRVNELMCDSLRIYAPGVERTFRATIEHIFARSPDSLVSPCVWRAHSTLLLSILFEAGVERGVMTRDLRAAGVAEEEDRSDALDDVIRRNETLMLRHLPPSSENMTSHRLQVITLLNSTASGTISTISDFFRTDPNWHRNLDFLLTWSVTDLQIGDYRPYAAVNLLVNWIHSETVSDLPSSDAVQDYLFDWLESHSNPLQFHISAVSRLFGELIRRGVFSYHRYVQRLIARCERLGVDDEDRSCHSEYLRHIPLPNFDTSIIRQRRMILYGHKCRTTREELDQQLMQEQLQSFFPILNGSSEITEKSSSSIHSQLAEFFERTLYEQEYVLQNWLIPVLRSTLERNSSPSISEINAFCSVLEFCALSRSYWSILRIVCTLLRCISSQTMLEIAVEMAVRFAAIWSLMNAQQMVCESLLAAVPLWRLRNLDLRPVAYLVEALRVELHLPAEFLREVSATISSRQAGFTRGGLQPLPLPKRITELQNLALETDPEACLSLADHVWEKYGHASEFGWVIWDTIFASIRQLPITVVDVAAQSACVLRFANLLRFVHDRLPGGLDRDVSQWLMGVGREEIMGLPSTIWFHLAMLLTELVICGVLRCSTISSGVLCRAWEIASRNSQDTGVSSILQSIEQLSLVTLVESSSELPEFSARAHFRLASERATLLRGPAVWDLVHGIPNIVRVEMDQRIEGQCRARLGKIRRRWTTNEEFRVAIFTDLDRFCTPFISCLCDEAYQMTLRSAIADAGRLAVAGHEDNSAALLGGPASVPWSLQRVAVCIRLTLLQHASMEGESSSEQSLDSFVDTFFENVSLEESDILSASSRGIGVKLRPKFLAAGLRRVNDLIGCYRDARHLSENHQYFISKTGCTLRVLSCLTEPWSAEQMKLTSQEQEILNSFAISLFTCLNDMLSLLEAQRLGSEPSIEDGTVLVSTIALLKLLHLILSFGSNLNPGSKSLLPSVHARLLSAVPSLLVNELIDASTANLILDTAAWIFDELTGEDSDASTSPQEITLDDLEALSSLCPPSFLARITSMTSTTSLQGVERDLTLDVSQNSHGMSFQARPWEWLNHSEIADDPNDTAALRNATSIAFGNFSVVAGEELAMGEHVGEDQNSVAVAASCIATVNSVPIFERDWRESRTTLMPLSPSHQTSYSIGSNKQDGEPAMQTNMASPAPSIPSRSSAHGSVGSWKQSPTVKGSSSSDAVEDPQSAGTLGKRRASEDALDTDAGAKKSKIGRSTRSARAKKK